MNRDLGFREADRRENVRRTAEVAKLMYDAGLVTLAACISPFESDRDFARSLIPPGKFIEVFVATPLEVCEDRDAKGFIGGQEPARSALSPASAHHSSDPIMPN